MAKAKPAKPTRAELDDAIAQAVLRITEAVVQRLAVDLAITSAPEPDIEPEPKLKAAPPLRKSPLDVKCPFCGASPGEVCLTSSGAKRTSTHAQRTSATLLKAGA